MDLVLDLKGTPGKRYAIRDDFYPRAAYTFLELAYAEHSAPRQSPDGSIRLPGNPLAEPDLNGALRRQIVLGGGMMGRMMTAVVDGQEMDARSMFRSGVAWAMNGVAATGHAHDPLMTLERERSYVIELINDTAWPHPMHLHGHSFRVISRNGEGPSRTGHGRTRCCFFRGNGWKSPSSPTIPATGCFIATSSSTRSPA
jgi:FtsP/CotA-like multicopper oxidase with cupredoxin domain